MPVMQTNHAELLEASIIASNLAREEFYSRCGITRSGVSRWRSRGFIPEARRKAIADLSNGAVSVEDFTAAWQLHDD